MAMKTNNKGVTLIELIISIAILSIVITALFSILSFSNKIFHDGSKQYNVQSEVRIISDYVIESILFATTLEIEDIDYFPSDPFELSFNPDYSYLYVNNGKLYHEIGDGATFKRVILGNQLDYISVDGNNEQIIITIFGDDSGQIYELKREILLPNIKINPTQNISPPGAGNVIKYSTSPDFAYTGGSN